MKLFIVCLFAWAVICFFAELIGISTSKQKISFVKIFAKGLIAAIITTCILGGFVYIF